MKYIYTNDPIEMAAKDVADRLIEHLSRGERVLWLVSGGSSIPIAIMASKKILDINLSKLFVSITDERYGSVGHNDENWQQLLDGGFDLPGANLYRPLIGADIQKTTAAFNEWLLEQFNKSSYSLGIFGLGADGHTAGIKPGSSAAKSTELAMSFTAEDFERVTISFVAIARIKDAIIQASGANKRQIIHDLMYYNLPVEEQPAQILKTIPDTTIYTNIQKEEI